MGLGRATHLKSAVVLLGLVVPAMLGFGMDLEEMLTRAVGADARLKSLSRVLANSLLRIDRAMLAPGFQLQLSTGEARLGYSFNPAAGDPPWVVTAEPSGALVLGRRTETEVRVDVPFALNFGEGSAPALAAAPRISVRQPLDKLFGGEKLTKVQDLESFLAAERARVDVLNRVNEVQRAVLHQLFSLVEQEQSSAQLQRDLAQAREALQQAAKLGTYAEDSAQQRQLEFAASKLKRESELNALQYATAWQGLERLIGQKVDALPPALPDPVLQQPAAARPETDPAVYLARLAVDLENARLEEERDPARPKFFLGGSVRDYRNELTDTRETTVGAGLEGVFDDFSVSAGGGYVVETGTAFVSAGFSWSLRDRKIESLNLEERKNALEASRWNLSAAREAYLSAREILVLEIEELDLRGRTLAEDRALAEIRLAEATRWLEQGLVAQGKVDEVRWERDRLDYAARMLQLDALLLRNRLEALTAPDGEQQ